MMVKQPWEIGVGERVGEQKDGDSLLTLARNERERKRIKRQGEIEDAEHEAKLAKLEKEKTIAEASTEKTGEKKEESGGGIKVDGAFKFGTIDYQAMLQEQMAERDRLREQAEESAANQKQVSDDLRERLHASEIQVIKTSFEAQMQLLTKMIEQNASKGNFSEQLAATREIATQMGFVQATPNGGDAMVQIELKKLDFEHQRAMREAAKADKAEERKWQLELRRLDEEKEFNKAKLALEKENSDFWKTLPTTLADAVGQGIAAGGENETPVTTPAKKAQHYELPVPIGEGGTTRCPGCGTEVGVGPTAKIAICANCDTKISVKRVQPANSSERIKGAEQDTEQHDDEE